MRGIENSNNTININNESISKRLLSLAATSTSLSDSLSASISASISASVSTTTEEKDERRNIKPTFPDDNTNTIFYSFIRLMTLPPQIEIKDHSVRIKNDVAAGAFSFNQKFEFSRVFSPSTPDFLFFTKSLEDIKNDQFFIIVVFGLIDMKRLFSYLGFDKTFLFDFDFEIFTELIEGSRDLKCEQTIQTSEISSAMYFMPKIHLLENEKSKCIVLFIAEEYSILKSLRKIEHLSKNNSKHKITLLSQIDDIKSNSSFSALFGSLALSVKSLVAPGNPKIRKMEIKNPKLSKIVGNNESKSKNDRNGHKGVNMIEFQKDSKYGKKSELNTASNGEAVPQMPEKIRFFKPKSRQQHKNLENETPKPKTQIPKQNQNSKPETNQQEISEIEHEKYPNSIPLTTEKTSPQGVKRDLHTQKEEPNQEEVNSHSTMKRSILATNETPDFDFDFDLEDKMKENVSSVQQQKASLNSSAEQSSIFHNPTHSPSPELSQTSSSLSQTSSSLLQASSSLLQTSSSLSSDFATVSHAEINPELSDMIMTLSAVLNRSEASSLDVSSRLTSLEPRHAQLAAEHEEGAILLRDAEARLESARQTLADEKKRRVELLDEKDELHSFVTRSIELTTRMKLQIRDASERSKGYIIKIEKETGDELTNRDSEAAELIVSHELSARIDMLENEIENCLKKNQNH